MANGSSNGGVRIVDGQNSFSGGINSGQVPTIASENYPEGLRRNMLAWLTNATVRGGGISQRWGWKGLVKNKSWPGIYQGGYMYEPLSGLPYLVVSIGGRIYRIRVDSDDSVEDLSAAFNLFNPPNVPHAFFVQGEEFLVIQAGDLSTLPLFWDGNLLRRSVGFLGNPVGPVTPSSFTVTIQNLQGTTGFPAFAQVGYVFPAGTVFTVFAAESPFDVNIGTITLVNNYSVQAIGNSATVFVTADNPSLIFPFPAGVSRYYFKATYPAGGIPGNPTPTTTYSMRITAKQTNSGGGGMPISTVSELPAAGPMDYYMGRIWYAFGRQYVAGDIVRSQVSGTGFYNFRDSILKVTENPTALSGDAFLVPTNAGNITALSHTANINTALGQGSLLVFTRRAIYATDVPVKRADWIALTEPLQKVAQRDFGSVGDRCIVPVNGDLFYQAIDGIRSFTVAVRNFNQWGNVPISRAEERALNFNDQGLMSFASGINFDNRLWQTVMPFQTDRGVAHQGIMPLDFDVLDTFGEKAPPAWEGILEGLWPLQLFTDEFNGEKRAFAMVVSKHSGNIELWEFTTDDKWDSQINYDGDRVTWFIETPAYTWGDPFMLKKLDGLELWVDKMAGTVQFMVEYFVDQNPCPFFWHAWKECVAKSCKEDAESIFCPTYPVQPYCEGFRATMTLPTPPNFCEINNARPTIEGYQFQVRITIKGWCRVRGLRIYALPKARPTFDGLVCGPESPFFA